MAQINVQPRVFKNYLVKIGSDNYEKHVSEVTLIPSTSVQTWKGAAPDASFTDTTAATWTAQLAFAQDWETDDSLSQYLFENEGEQVAMEFSPTGASDGPKFALNVIIAPGQAGGAVDAYGTATVTLGVQSRPTFSAGV